MRTIIVFAVIAATLALGGCFHHRQAVAEVPLETTPYK
jgi:outer membrane murein-binding lipoprotein Lpp